MQVIIFPEVLQKKRKRKNERFALDAGVRERYRKQQDRVLQTPRNHPPDKEYFPANQPSRRSQ